MFLPMIFGVVIFSFFELSASANNFEAMDCTAPPPPRIYPVTENDFVADFASLSLAENEEDVCMVPTLDANAPLDTLAAKKARRAAERYRVEQPSSEERQVYTLQKRAILRRWSKARTPEEHRAFNRLKAALLRSPAVWHFSQKQRLEKFQRPIGRPRRNGKKVNISRSPPKDTKKQGLVREVCPQQ